MDLLMLCVGKVPPWLFFLMTGALAYISMVSLFRHQRARYLERTYSPMGRASFKDMSDTDAQIILKTLAELEFPKTYGFSMIVALFRVWPEFSIHLGAWAY